MNRSDSTRSRPLQHPRHRRFQVVVTDPGRAPRRNARTPGHGRPRTPPGASFRYALGNARPDADRRMTNSCTSTSKPGQIDADRPEIDLGLLAQRVMLRDHHLHQRHLLAAADLGHVAAHRRLAHLAPRAPPPAAATPAAPCGAAYAAPADPPPTTPSITGFHAIQHRRRPAPPPSAPAAPATPTPGGHPDDAPRTGATTPGSTPPPARCPADLLVQAHLRPLRHHPPSKTSTTQLVDPQGGAKSDEHYRPSGARSEEHTHRG